VRKTIVVLIPAILAQATGNVFLSMSMKEIGISKDWLPLLIHVAENPAVWLGTALLAASFILFASALSWADLSFVVPAVSAEVMVNAIFARHFLREAISLARWTGVLFISLGVVLVLRSERQKTRRAEEEALRSDGR
jgi:drug/metabolite transporter (DMT)-like permease